MIDVILILAIITGLTIVAVRYGRRLLVLGGVALARAFEETADTDTESDFEEWCTDPLYAPLPCNVCHHHYEEFRHKLHSKTG